LKEVFTRPFPKYFLNSFLIVEINRLLALTRKQTMPTQTEGQRQTTRMTETEDFRLHHRSHLQLQQQQQPQQQPPNNSVMFDNTSTPAQSSSWAGSKRSRMISGGLVVPSMPQPNTMMHPVEEINQISRKIVNGDFDGAIVSLTKTLKNIKLVLSGDAKITMPPAKESSKKKNEDQTMSDDPNWMDEQRDHKKENENVSLPCAFEYDFFYPSQHNYSSFLKTSVTVQKRSSYRHEQHQTQTIQVQQRSVTIFQNPLIVKGDCFEVPLDSHLCEELSCVAIYNLALSLQLNAISLSSKSTSKSDSSASQTQAYLFKALSLYEYSHQIFKNQAIPVRVPTLHCMALVNNLGQIHHLLGKSTKAQQCNEYLLSVLMYTIDVRKETNNNNLQTTPPQQQQRDDMLLDGFLTIVQHLIISEDCTAAAA
jgi:hypothetical protein